MKVAIVDYPMEEDGVDADEILNDLRKMLRLQIVYNFDPSTTKKERSKRPLFFNII